MLKHLRVAAIVRHKPGRFWRSKQIDKGAPGGFEQEEANII